MCPSIQLTLPVHPDPVRDPRALWPVHLQAADVLAKAGEDELGLGGPSIAEKRILVTIFHLKTVLFPKKSSPGVTPIEV